MSKSIIKKGEIGVRKVFLCMIFALFAAVSTNAYAAGAVYSDETNKVTAENKSNIQTVLITNTEGTVDTEDDIFYIDQAVNSSLDAAIGFLMKANPQNGRYYMKLYNGETTEMLSFTIGEVNVEDKALLPLNNAIVNGDSYSVAFVTSDDLYIEDYNIVKFAFEQNGTTKYLGYPLSSLESFTEFSLGNNEKRFFGVQLNGNISRYGTVSAAYLSDSKLAEGGGNP